MESFVSPRYTNHTFGSNPTIEDKSLVFEDRELGWRIAPAKALNEVQDAGYAIVSVLFAYFEMIYQYVTGKSSIHRSPEFFRQGFREVYPNSEFSDSDIALIYEKVRCGMYHSGMTKVDTLLSGDFPEAITVRNDVVLVNPHKLVEDVESHLRRYVSQLRNENETQKRERFERTFDRGLTN